MRVTGLAGPSVFGRLLLRGGWLGVLACLLREIRREARARDGSRSSNIEKLCPTIRRRLGGSFQYRRFYAIVGNSIVFAAIVGDSALLPKP